jgi:BlaI family penicillinase repressor
MEDSFSRRERQIMDVLFQQGEATANAVQQRMPDAPSYTAVRTLLKILEEKGWVRHREDGRRYVYMARRSQEVVGRSALQRVLRVFYGGSLEQALAAHLSDPDSGVDDAELQRMRELIDQAGETNVTQRKSKKRPRNT